MNIKLRRNDQMEGFDLIDTDSNQSHDGDNSGEWIATVYDRSNAENIAALLNLVTNSATENVTKVTDETERLVRSVISGLAHGMRR